ncbi:MAG: N-acetylmuramoyl-L-alanine amidase [Paenibacillaceae bacterium]
MKRYLYTTLFVMFLALALPNLSQFKLTEDIPSYSASEVESNNHNVNGLVKQQPIHKGMFKFYFPRNRFSNQPLFSSINSKGVNANEPIVKDEFKIMIDAGHGGRDPGSPGVSKKEEKLFTLSLANKVYGLLQHESSITPILTRKDDSYITTDDRVAIANRDHVDLFISLHANSFTNKNTRGIETYYHNSISISLANLLHSNLIQATGFPDRMVRQMDYKVIKETTMPAVLLEIGYLSNPTEESIMISEDMQNKVAASIVKGIKEYMKSELY